jgi:hypothetical protein
MGEGPAPLRALWHVGYKQSIKSFPRVNSGFGTGKSGEMTWRLSLQRRTRVVAVHKITGPLKARIAGPEFANLAGLGHALNDRAALRNRSGLRTGKANSNRRPAEVNAGRVIRAGLIKVIPGWNLRPLKLTLKK